MRLEILAVAVPPGPANSNERHASLDQPPCNERLFAKQSRAVSVADLRRLLRNIEEFFAGHQAAHTLIRLIVTAQTRRHPAPYELLAQQVAQLSPLFVVEI